MMSQKQVVREVRRLSSSPEDPKGIMAAALASLLDWRRARRYLSADARALGRQVWEGCRIPFDVPSVVGQMQAAWNLGWKAANKRDDELVQMIVWQLRAWAWALDDVETAQALDQPLRFHGKPHLVQLAGRIAMNPPWSRLDDGLWEDGGRVVSAQVALGMAQRGWV